MWTDLDVILIIITTTVLAGFGGCMLAALAYEKDMKRLRKLTKEADGQ